MRIHSLLHEPFEDTGYIRIWAEEKGHPFSETLLYAGEPFPDTDDFDLLVIMGGTMNIYEEDKFPWLSGEKEFIRAAIDSGKKVLGICLGGQLIADVLGAPVRKNKYPEVGWFSVEKTADAEMIPLCRGIPYSFTVFQWHGDTFGIPDDAVNLFRSTACENQGFLYRGRVIGLQFHPEMTEENLKSLTQNCYDELKGDRRFIQPLAEILKGSNIRSANVVMVLILKYFEDL
ncbi:type 1 glutamine amidotransferase [Methanolacinia paynteri]|uniref:type 1 glutamine amidotransferase n=1 Tax=Methanolacinia paynteri TaxID=230356 RepID=UPI00064FBD3D|nr:type 1 glutamine amidotransferase [Methanolacinia paynteri]